MQYWILNVVTRTQRTHLVRLWDRKPNKNQSYIALCGKIITAKWLFSEEAQGKPVKCRTCLNSAKAHDLVLEDRARM